MSSLTTDKLINQNSQLCKAWVNFNGTGTVAIRDGYNVSSVTDNGTGDYTVNFINDLPNSNYICCPIGGEAETSGAYISSPAFSDNGGAAFGYAEGSVRFRYYTVNGGRVDIFTCGLAIFSN